MDAVLLDIATKRSRELGVTHEMRGVVNDIKQLLFDGPTSIKYRVYSAHDSNIAAWLAQFAPTYEWHGIPYAANIHIELYESENRTKWVQFRYNGTPLKLEACQHTICA